MCLLTQGRIRGCTTYNTPGVQNEVIYIANFEQVTGYTITSAGTLSNLSMSGSSKFFKVEFDENPKVTVTEGVDENKIVTQTITGTIYGDDASTVAFYDTINKGRFVAIVESNNAVARVFGLDSALKGNASYSNADTLNGSTVTLTAVGLSRLAPVIAPTGGTVTAFINALL